MSDCISTRGLWAPLSASTGQAQSPGISISSLGFPGQSPPTQKKTRLHTEGRGGADVAQHTQIPSSAYYGWNALRVTPWTAVSSAFRKTGTQRELERAMGGSCAQRRPAGRRQVLFPFLLPLFYPALGEPIRYAIPEELAKGSVVGNLAKDLGLSVLDVSARKLRVSTEKLLFKVDAENGDLLVKDRIDREQICKERRRCELQLEAVVENPLNIFHIIVVVEDINDHAPQFDKKEVLLEISESVSEGARISLDPATDLDIDMNSVKDYQINPNPYFSLMVRVNSDGSKYPELSLEKLLDREQQHSHHLILTALDGGNPPRSATTRIEISVRDANDNFPVFSKDEYRISVSENLPPGSSMLQVTATDKDEGVNAEVNYYFRSTAQRTRYMFSLDEKTGMIKNNQSLDFEDTEKYTMEVEARDGGGLSTQCKVVIEILDENDNRPEIIITSLSHEILEDSLPGMVVVLFKTRDKDFGANGEVMCNIGKDIPFKIYSSSNNYYKLVTDEPLDREQTPEYNVTITATDRGNPPLSSRTTITLHITDVNDNAPVFHQDSYVVHVMENNPPGASIAQVSASDPDLGPNGHVSYSIVASDLEPRALASYVSVNTQSGVVFAQRAFDHEQLLQEVLPDVSDRPEPSDPQAELQFYLVVALALISVLFLLAVILAVALRLRRSSSPTTWDCFQPGLCVKSGPVVPPNYSEGTLPYSYNLCVAQTGKTEFNFLKCSELLHSTQDIVCGDSSGALIPLQGEHDLTTHPEMLTPA
ncbi:protocadherin gamma-B6-like [Suricata suricatta]|uniref:protocadherin gamma-B6-like n=1 Tax=Suricata suricatta TaxID=37032 RepID=UPI0011556907|nr:protocadherin gamma-B6-like [Suricata suricatta]